VWLIPLSVITDKIYRVNGFYYAIQFYLFFATLDCVFYPNLMNEDSYFLWSPLSVILTLCTVMLSLVCYIIIEFRIDTRVRLLHFCIFLIQALSITFFSTQNLFTFYVLFELVLVPFFLIIIGWGSPGKNIKAALLFFLLYVLLHHCQCYLL
jgi:formate hydrogenlyase subunit 3/multisubunit Na+/H+ antiporter MnhD subunit